MFNTRVLDLNVAAEAQRIEEQLARTVRGTLRRQGAVVGISGGIDSSVVLAMCVRCFGPERVTAVMMPEKESSPASEALAREVAASCGVTPVREDITASLEGHGCYRRRDDAIRKVFPDYDPLRGYKAKITLPSSLSEQEMLTVFRLTVVAPDGATTTEALPVREFRQIVAASNFKQRMRMAVLYHHAELHHRAVIGTANKNEHDLGFFVKYGDGGIDVLPIAHLYKVQVYQLAKHYRVPESIQRSTPTTDTYSAPSTQEEFFFRLPFEILDVLWYAMEKNVPVREVASVMNLTEEQVRHAQADIARKLRAAEYLRRAPICFEAQSGRRESAAAGDHMQLPTAVMTAL